MANIKLGQTFDTTCSISEGGCSNNELSLYTFTESQWFNLTALQWYGLLAFGTFSPEKVALFLRLGERSRSKFFEFNSSVSIDFANYYSKTQNNLFFILVDDISQVIKTQTSDGDTSEITTGESPLIDYYIKGEDQSYVLWLKTKTDAAMLQFDVLFDDILIYSVDVVPPSSDWEWRSLQLVLPDKEVHKITVRPRRAETYFNRLYITDNGTVPSGEGPVLDPSPYVTIHLALWSCDGDNVPVSPLQIYDAKNSYDMSIDGWYVFDTRVLGNDVIFSGKYAVVLSASGGGDDNFVMWDFTSEKILFPSAVYNGADWSLDSDLSYALLVYSDYPLSSHVPCGVNIPAAQSKVLKVVDFDPTVSTFVNTKIDDDAYSDNFGDVVLDLQRRSLSFVIDQSGSMTWNDANNTRLTIAKRMVNRLDGTYPGEIDYNLFVYRAKEIETILFATTQNFGKDNVNDINDAFFKSNGSGLAGIRVVRRDDTYPISPLDGKYFDGIFSKIKDTGLEPGNTYYYTVYTFDGYRYSLGKNIVAKSVAKSTTRGITYASSVVFKGTGLEVDSGVIGVWHMNEGASNKSYDFSATTSTLTIVNAQWVDSADVPTGFGGLRFNGTSSQVYSGDVSGSAVNSTFTVMGWVYPFAFDGMILARQNSGNTNYAVKYGTSGKIQYSCNGSVYVDGPIVSLNVWTHFAVRVSLLSGGVEFFINGVSAGTATLPSTATFALAAMHTDIGWDSRSLQNTFFGKMTEISVHNQYRSASYIAAASIGNINEFQDNGDRIVVLKYLVPAEITGNVVILSNPDNVPSNPTDGDVLLDAAVVTGENELVHSDPFNIHKANYRIFVRSVDENYSANSDSASISLIIPFVDLDNVDVAPPSPSLETVSALVATPGNGKVYLQWVMPTDTRVTVVRVYASLSDYPIVNNGVVTGQLLFTTDSKTEYVDPLRQNNTKVFYSLVSFNKFGQTSDIVSVSTIPLLSLPNLTIPLADVKELYSESFDDTSIIVGWKNPSRFTSNVTAYFDQKVYIYASIIDHFGNIINDLSKVQMSVSGLQTSYGSNDVFSTATSVVDLSNAFEINASYDSNGLIRGVLDLQQSGDSLGNLETVKLSVRVTITQPDATSAVRPNGDFMGSIFTFTSQPISVTFVNPITTTITNIGQDFIDDSNSITGCYIRRHTPFLLGLTTSYKGVPISNIGYHVAIYEGDTLSQNVSLTSSSFSSPTTSIVIPIDAPQVPADVVFYAKTTYNGYLHVVQLPIFFANILKIQLSPSIPVADGLDVREEFAQAWIIDANDPSQKSNVPDDVVVKWELDPVGTPVSPDRPFYSTDPVDLPDGVYSFLFNGTSRDVFFGPISDIDPNGETHTVKVTVVNDGLTATDSNTFIIPSLASASDMFLITFSGVTYHYGDGESWIKLMIVHNPAVSSLPEAANFIANCVANDRPIITLEAGQLITITTNGNYEIIWGKGIEESVDPYTSEPVLILDDSANIGVGSTAVQISDENTTSVYFRIEKIGNFSAKVTATGTTVIDSSLVGLVGSTNGLVAGTNFLTKEPLSIVYIDQRADNEPSDTIIVDGSTKNSIVVLVSFSGLPVPNGTPVNISIDSDPTNVLGLIDTVVYTKTKNDPFINATGPEYSFATFKLAPILSVNTAFTASMKATVSFDRLAFLNRVSTLNITIKYDPTNQFDGSVSAVFSDKIYKYNVLSDAWSTLIDLRQPRAAAVMEYAGGNLYVIGGMDGRSISVANEIISGLVSSYGADMITPRFYAMSVCIGTDIYVIGGMTQNKIAGEIVVSTAFEKYDAVNDSWTSLAPMPSIDVGEPDLKSYGVAMGVAKYISGKIYVLCGFISTSDSSLISEMNDRVLVFDISSGTWDYSEAFIDEDLSLYKRISPVAFVNGSNIHVAGGSLPDSTGGDPPSLYVTDAFYVSSTLVITASDNLYSQLPEFKYKSCSTRIGNNVYVVGGSNANTTTLNTTEVINTSTSPFGYSLLSDIGKGLNAASMASDGTDLYVAGGICSGRDVNFLQLSITSSNRTMLLDGQQSSTIKIVAKDDNGNAPASLDVTLAAFTTPASSSGTEIPVLLTDKHITLVDGKGSSIMLPRSEDVLFSKDAVLVSGTSRNSYLTSVEATIKDGYWDGVTKATNDTSSTRLPIIGEGTSSVTVFASSNLAANNRGVFINSVQSKASVFDFTPPIFQQNGDLVLTATSSVDWIPRIDTLIGNDSGTGAQMIAAIDELNNAIPFGPSPMYDSLYEMCLNVLEIDSMGIQRSVYLFSDDADSVSTYGLADVLSQLDSVGQRPSFPVVGLNFGISEPFLESARLRYVDQFDVQQIVDVQGGEAYTIVSTTDMDVLIDEVIGSVVGSVGYGAFQYVVDLGEITAISQMSLGFNLFNNSSASWTFAASDNGLEYSPTSESFFPNTEVNFTSLDARYLKFSATISSGISEFNTDGLESTEAAQQPSLYEISITHSQSTESFIYLNNDVLPAHAHEFIITANMDFSNDCDVFVGMTSDTIASWDRMFSGSQPLTRYTGRVVVPNRLHKDILNEPLDQSDAFLFKSRYGKWDANAVVSVYSSSGTVVDVDTYSIYPDKGNVVFTSPQTDTFTISVNNISNARLGMKIINRSADTPVVVRGVSYSYAEME